MTHNIEIKAVLDSVHLGNAIENFFHDRSSFVSDLRNMMDVPDRDELDDYKYDIVNSSDLESNVESIVENWIENSDLYYLPDTVSGLTDTVEDLEEVDNSQANRLRTLEEDNLHERLEKVEDRLSMDDWSEEDNREISRLQERVDKLEEINKRLFHLIHNIQGVKLT